MNKEAFITRTGTFLPNRPVDNEAVGVILGDGDRRAKRTRQIVLSKNGIQTRHYAFDPISRKFSHTNAQMTAQAVRNLSDSEFKIDEVDCLACGTTAADQLVPGHGVMVHGELDWPICEVVSTSGVCCSGVSSLKHAYLSVLAGNSRRAVATGSELSSPTFRADFMQVKGKITEEDLHIHPEHAFSKEFLRWMLSDGAGAFLIEAHPRKNGMSLRIDWCDIYSYANTMPVCMYGGTRRNSDGTFTGWMHIPPEQWARDAIFQIGQDVRLLNAEIGGNFLQQPFSRLLERHNLKTSDIDWFLPHMSSEYFRAPIDRGLRNAKLPIPQDKWFTNLSTVGNVGSASMYLMLDELWKSGRLEKGQKILCFVPESGRFTFGYVYLTAV